MNLPKMSDAKKRTRDEVRILYDDYNLDDLDFQNGGQQGSEYGSAAYRNAHLPAGFHVQIAFLLEYGGCGHELQQHSYTCGSVCHVNREAHHHEKPVGNGGCHSGYGVYEAHEYAAAYKNEYYPVVRNRGGT